MVTAVLEKSKKNTYQNPYVLERCFLTSHSEFLCASSKVKPLTRSVGWFQRGITANKPTAEMQRDSLRMKKLSISQEDLNKYLFTIPETATLLSCSPATIYKWMEQGKLLSVYPTSKARITKDSIVRFVKRLEEEARDAERGL